MRVCVFLSYSVLLDSFWLLLFCFGVLHVVGQQQHLNEKRIQQQQQKRTHHRHHHRINNEILVKFPLRCLFFSSRSSSSNKNQQQQQQAEQQNKEFVQIVCASVFARVRVCAYILYLFCCWWYCCCRRLFRLLFFISTTSSFSFSTPPPRASVCYFIICVHFSSGLKISIALPLSMWCVLLAKTGLYAACSWACVPLFMHFAFWNFLGANSVSMRFVGCLSSPSCCCWWFFASFLLGNTLHFTVSYHLIHCQNNNKRKQKFNSSRDDELTEE